MAHVLSGAFVLTSNCKIIGHSFFNRKRVINPKLTRSTLSQLRQIRISGKESIWESIWESSAVSPSAVSPSGRCDAMVVSVALARTNDHERPVPRRPVPGLETGRSIWLRDQGCLSAVSSGPRLLVEVACPQSAAVRMAGEAAASPAEEQKRDRATEQREPETHLPGTRWARDG